MKQCSKCGELKDESLFSTSRNQCKECRKIYCKQYELEHKEQRKKYSKTPKRKKYLKKYRIDNKEKMKQCSKKYEQDHKEELKQYRINHKGRKKQYDKKYNPNHKEERKKYRLENKDKTKKHNKNYRLNHKEELKKRGKRYYLDNTEQIKQCNKKYSSSEAGKLTRKKGNAKRRKIKYIPLINNPFPEDIEVEDHHILNNFHAIDSNNPWNKWFVIPMPKTIHNFVSGSSNNLDHWRHNEAWIRKLYGIDIKELLGIEKN